MKIINDINSLKFGSAIPVYYYSKDKSGKLYRLFDSKKIKECNSYIIRNLTGSKKEKDEHLIEMFKMFDGDYLNTGLIRSVYDKTSSLVYLITGKRDTKMIDSMGAEIGVAKNYSREHWGTTNSFEVFDTVKRYYQRAISYARRPEVISKDKYNKPRAIQAIFEPQYKRNGERRGFKFLDIIVTSESQIVSK